MHEALSYHNAEESAVSIFCLVAACQIVRRYRKTPDVLLFMEAQGFFILSFSGILHISAHVLGEIQGLLYGSLVNYSVGFASMLAAPFVQQESRVGRYLPSVSFLFFTVLFLSNTLIVDFFKARFSLWMPVGFFSSMLTVIYLSEYLKNKGRRDGALAVGFALVCVSSAFLFFPAGMGSFPWMAGHILRPVAFLLLALACSVRGK